MKRALFLYNPRSGQRMISARLDYVIKKFLSCNVLLHPFRIEEGSHLSIAPLLKNEGYSFMVVSGGDGTLSLAVNTMLKSGTSLPVGIIPSGTCNDLAASLSIGSSFKKSINIILEGNTREMDTGLINEERYFLNTCAGGAFTDVSYSTSDDLKKNIGQLAYYIKGLSELASIRSYHIKLETENETIEEKIMLFILLNGRNAAGFNNVSRQSDISDGLMEIILIKNCPPLEIPGLFFKVLNNNLLKDRRVVCLKANRCNIKSDSNTYLSVDGERAGQLPVSVRFIKRNLKVFAPQQS